MASKKFRLDVSSNNPMTLLGILTDENDLKLSWMLNQELNISLSRDEDMNWLSRELPNPLSLPVYSDMDSSIGPVRLIKNKSVEGLWIKGYKQVDYLIMILGEILPDNQKALMGKLQSMDIIRGAYLLDPEPLKDLIE